MTDFSLYQLTCRGESVAVAMANYLSIDACSCKKLSAAVAAVTLSASQILVWILAMESSPESLIEAS
jgi:hypothetical protein